MIALLLGLIAENIRLRQSLNDACYSDSFGCLNRYGGKVQGGALIQRDRRRCASGELVMVCADIGGMGKLNSAVGELEVNRRVRECLDAAQSMRGVALVAQVNSGDEFALVCDRNDVQGVAERLRELVMLREFSGLYFAVVQIDPGLTWIENANSGMAIVYEVKTAK